MQKINKLYTCFGLLFAGMILPPTAFTQINTSGISVGTQVLPNCKFTGGNTSMSFGSYDPTDVNVSAPLNTSTTFTLRCSRDSSAVISLNDGLYPEGNMRRLRGGVDYYLKYNLYKDAGHNSVWNLTNTVNYVANNSQPQTFTIYGQIPAGQDNIGVGSYSDTVVVTVTF